MKEFDWTDKWNCIIFRFCVGYLDKDDLINVLKKAKQCLKERNNPNKRLATKESYIIIQDQVKEDDGEEKKEYD